MKMIREVITPEDFPDWVLMAAFMIEKLKHDSDDMLPWVFLDKKIVGPANRFIAEQHSSRSLFAFAYREDSDEVACFEKSKPGKVVIVFKEEEPGYEDGPEFVSFEAWYNYTLNVEEGDYSYQNVPGIDFDPEAKYYK